MTRPVALLFGLAWLGLATPGRAQDDPPSKLILTPNGTELFRGLLDYRNVQPARDNAVSRNTIVIVYGRPGPVETVVVQRITQNVLTRGGAVLFLSDKEMDLSARPGQSSSYLLPYMLRAHIISASVGWEYQLRLCGMRCRV